MSRKHLTSPKYLPRTLAVLAAVAGMFWAAPSFACPVCFGDSDSPMAQAANLSILFMMIVTYAVILGGLATVFVLRMKARKKALAAAAATAAPAARRNS